MLRRTGQYYKVVVNCASGLVAACAVYWICQQLFTRPIEERLRVMTSVRLSLEEERDSLQLEVNEFDPGTLVELEQENRDIHKLRNEVASLHREWDDITAESKRREALKDSYFVLQKRVTNLEELRSTSHKAACARCLQVLSQAKDNWAQDHQMPRGSFVTTNHLVAYLPKWAVLRCPSGGAYALNLVGEPPSCSMTEHFSPGH